MKKFMPLFAAVLCAATGTAWAQHFGGAVPPPTPIDLTPVVQGVIALAGTALTVFGSWALTRVAQHFNVKISAEQQATFDVMLKKVIAFGGAKATDLVKQHGWSSVIVKDAILQEAAQAAVDKFPGTLKAVGLNPADPDFADNLADALNRAFPEAMTPVVNSPVTPPLTVQATPAPAVTPPV